MDAKTVWGALDAADGSVRIAACALRTSVGEVLEVVGRDPNAVITVRRAGVPRADSGPLPVFRLWVDDEDDEPAPRRP